MTHSSIRRVAVLGAGVMGSGIAAQVAGAGIPVLLLDVSREQVLAALDKLKKSKPPLLFHPRDLERIQVGDFAQGLAEAARCDWVVEVVKEDITIKQNLFAQLEPLLSSQTIVSSNTSGLQLSQLLEGRSEAFQRRFLITHFFNPVRYMHLLELVVGPKTDPDVVKTVATFGERVLGKGVVYANDTPNFVGNRIGLHALLSVIQRVFQGEYTVDEVDAVLGPVLGRAKSAVFRTADMVGLDTLVAVARNSYERLPHDEERARFVPPEGLVQLVMQGGLGEKAGRGFYKKTPPGIAVLDVHTGTYRSQSKPTTGWLSDLKHKPVEERLRLALQQTDRLGQLAQRATLETLAYASKRVGPRKTAEDPAICADLAQIDRAMRWGFNWEMGPFEMWDAIGVASAVQQMDALGIQPASWVREMIRQGGTRFYTVDAVVDANHIPTQQPIARSSQVLSLAQVRVSQKPVLHNDGAALWDLGDGVACLEFRTKLNVIDGEVIAFFQQAAERCERDFQGLVIGNEGGEAFCAGANLMMILMVASQGDWTLLDKVIHDFQQGVQRLKYSAVPVVIAPFGLTLGGGTEVVLHGAAAHAHMELYMGLVETGVGLIPAGGGCKEMLGRALARWPEDADAMPAIRRLFEMIALAKVSSSAEDARQLGYLHTRDLVSLRRDTLLTQAKSLVLGLAQAGYRPPRPHVYRLPGPSGYATLRAGLLHYAAAHQITDYDVVVGSELARVLTGGQTSPLVTRTEQDVLDLERESFLRLCGEEKTRARITHMLQTNKPLRN